MLPYLAHLNNEQREAVLHGKGPLLVVAGAGAGKTKTLTSRIYHLIQSGVAPSQILAITFTNKAAAEMKERVVKLLDSPWREHESPWIGTFHALGAYILRHHGSLINIPRHFTILDSDDQQALIREILAEFSIDPKAWDPKIFRSVISKNKNNLISVATHQQSLGNENMRIIGTVWRRYEELLRERGQVDFDDLLVESLRLLRDHSTVRNLYTERWGHLLVDEYQDTNGVQYELLRLLGEKERNICVVGDIDQNIYSWRGADMRHMLRFEKDYPGAKVVTLTKNYRSTDTILEAADALISKNKNRLPKIMTGCGTKGELIVRYAAISGGEEGNFVAASVRENLKKGIAPHDIAVLYRMNWQSRSLEESFLSERIPYQLVGTAFFDRKEVKDILSYLRAAFNRTSFSDIKRSISIPKRGIGKVALAKILAGEIDSLAPGPKKSYIEYLAFLDAVKTYAVDHNLSETLKYIIDRTKIQEIFHKEGEEGEERIGNLKELVSYAARFDILPTGEEGITQFLETVALMSDQDNLGRDKDADQKVRLMTIHAAKGLEFRVVYLVGLEEGIFPSTIADAERDPEEERRLMYVAITRAREKLILSHAYMRRIYGEERMQAPSSFFEDIPEHLIQQESASSSSLAEKLPTVYLE